MHVRSSAQTYFRNNSPLAHQSVYPVTIRLHYHAACSYCWRVRVPRDFP
jgi:hypothetical protein